MIDIYKHIYIILDDFVKDASLYSDLFRLILVL